MINSDFHSCCCSVQILIVGCQGVEKCVFLFNIDSLCLSLLPIMMKIIIFVIECFLKTQNQKCFVKFSKLYKSSQQALNLLGQHSALYCTTTLRSFRDFKENILWCIFIRTLSCAVLFIYTILYNCHIICSKFPLLVNTFIHYLLNMKLLLIHFDKIDI